MKKFLIAALMLLAINCVYSQNVVRNGNIFKTEKTISKADTLSTNCQWEDTKGAKYTIIVNKKSGACYVWRKSNKTGKMYKQYLGEEISRTVCKELGITYVSKKQR